MAGVGGGGHDDRAAWRGLRGRNYAEEGIPVILGIETVGEPPPGGGEAELADAFRRLADGLAGADGADPAALLEVLAARALDRLD